MAPNAGMSYICFLSRIHFRFLPYLYLGLTSDLKLETFALPTLTHPTPCRSELSHLLLFNVKDTRTLTGLFIERQSTNLVKI